jgi:hypothetical protein
MANNVFDSSKIYRTMLWGHGFTSFPEMIERTPYLPGTFAADTVEVSGQPGDVNEFAVFTVAEPVNNEFPAAWVGTYRLPFDKILQNPPEYIGEVQAAETP